MTLEGAEVIVDGLYFPECLRWREGKLWYSDMLARSVQVWDAGTARTILDLPDDTGGLGWLPDGDMLVVGMRDRVVHRLGADGGRSLHADLRPFIEHGANDMYVDADGRAFVGSFGFDVDNGAPPREVGLLVVEPTGEVTMSSTSFVFPNGIDEMPRSDGGRALVVSETFAQRVTQVTLESDGTIGESRTLATLEPGDGPDGLSVDAGGGVWVGCAYGEKVVHVDASGEVDHVLPTPGAGAVCCVLGGPDRDTLFVALVGSVNDEVYAAAHPTGSIVAIPEVAQRLRRA